jgi:hypothetical protein
LRTGKAVSHKPPAARRASQEILTMIAFSPLKLALYCALFFIGGLQARPIMNALVSGDSLRALDVAALCGLLLVGVLGVSQGKRIPR